MPKSGRSKLREEGSAILVQSLLFVYYFFDFLTTKNNYTTLHAFQFSALTIPYDQPTDRPTDRLLAYSAKVQ